jgi:protein ImuA
MLDELRQHLARLQKPAGLVDGPAVLPLGVPAVDGVLGGGLARGALHEISALSEAHVPAATGFALGLAALANATRAGHIVWVADDMTLAESGAPHGAGLDAFALAPQRLVTVAVPYRQDLMWAMEEALRCRAVGAVIGEMRHGALDAVAVRRLSLAAGDSGALAFLLRAQPPHDASTAATRWTVAVAPSATSHRHELGAPRFAVHLTRNRRGPAASWFLEWRPTDERFVLAAHAEPVAAPLRHRSHQKVA